MSILAKCAAEAARDGRAGLADELSLIAGALDNVQKRLHDPELGTILYGPSEVKPEAVEPVKVKDAGDELHKRKYSGSTHAK
jgi:hypothetical protein